MNRRSYFMFKKNKPKDHSKVIEIESGMEGNLTFSSPVNLKINSRFEGTLDTKGTLIIGEKADIKVKHIKGEDITIAGKVEGDIICSERLALHAPAKVVGNVKAPLLIVNEGAMLKGSCEMPIKAERSESREETAKSSKKKK